VLSHFFVLVVAVRRAVLMSAIDVIGKRHINTGKAKQLYALARIVNLVSGIPAPSRGTIPDSTFRTSFGRQSAKFWTPAATLVG
jgi:hypothetical protein